MSEVRQHAVVGPGGRIEIVAPGLPEGAEAEVVVRIAEPTIDTGNGSHLPERPVDGFTEIVQWFHNGEWRGKVKGTGLEVWEIIDGYVNVDRDFGRLLVVWHWLPVEQIRQALQYAVWFPDEIGELIRRQYDGAPPEFAMPPFPTWP